MVEGRGRGGRGKGERWEGVYGWRTKSREIGTS